MLAHCQSTSNQTLISFLSFIFLTFFLSFFSEFFTTLYIIYHDHSQLMSALNFIHDMIHSTPTILDTNLTSTVPTKKHISLSIDTTRTNLQSEDLATNKPQNDDFLITSSSIEPESPDSVTHHDGVDPIFSTTKKLTRKRYYSISQTDTDYTPLLSPTSSISSFSSNWSTDTRRSRVEEMIYLFESGSHNNKQPYRRYSMDSHTYKKPLYIRERKFEYKPIHSEWKKRVSVNTLVVSPIASKSTPPLLQKMAPILEKSQSTWA